MTVEERRRRRFSEEFRKEQVSLIESGQVTVLEVSRLYEVRAANVRRWLKKFGKTEYPPQIVISSAKDIDRLRELEKENRKLKELIGKQQLELEIQKGILKLTSTEEQKKLEKK